MALIAVRNERLFLRTCLEHLIGQGVGVYVIDNESDDESYSIAESFLGEGVIGIERFPYTGWYELDKLLTRKEELARVLEAEWFMHQDADEIRLPPPPFESLHDAVAQVEANGYNAVNFDEFVFVPTDEGESFEGRHYPSSMSHYYFFEPSPLRQVKLWKKSMDVRLAASGGHRTTFERRQVCPVNFVMKHYIGLSRDHIVRKYSTRRFTPRLLENGWHGWRPHVTAENVRLPAKESLKHYAHDNIWDRSDPWRRHFFDPRPAACPREAQQVAGKARSHGLRSILHAWGSGGRGRVEA